MAGLLLVLCVVAVGAALGIVYLLYGPTAAKPLIAVPRASMATMPTPRAAHAGTYNPEAVFAVERSMSIADASRAAALITPVPAQFAPAPMPAMRAPTPPMPMPMPAIGTAPVTRAPTPAPLPPAPPLLPAAAGRSRTLPPPTPSFVRGRVTSPQPLHRARAARGTDAPRPMPVAPGPTYDLRDSFVDVDPTMIGDEPMAS